MWHDALTACILEENRHLGHFYSLFLGEAQTLVGQIHAGLLTCLVRDILRVHVLRGLLDLPLRGRIGRDLVVLAGENHPARLTVCLVGVGPPRVRNERKTVTACSLVEILIVEGQRMLCRHLLLCQGNWL